MDEELEREADCLRRIISGVIGRAENIEVYVRRNSIAESREEIIVRTGTVVAGEETLRGQHRIDSGWEEGRRAVLREILCAQAGANFVFKTLVAGEPGNRYRGKAVLLGAEVSALPEGKKAQILLVVHSGKVDAKAQALCNHKVESCIAGDLPVIRNVLSRDVRAAGGSVLASACAFVVELQCACVGNDAAPDDGGTRVAHTGIRKQAVLNAIADGQERKRPSQRTEAYTAR